MTFAARAHTLARVAATYVISANTDRAAVVLGTTPPTTGVYQSGRTDITVTVNSAVYAYSTVAGTAALAISGGSSGDTLTIENNGYILGCGGTGGIALLTTTGNTLTAPVAGSTGLSITGTYSGTSLLTNAASSYIAGGGGGGNYAIAGGNSAGGGGGAGGGAGGTAAAIGQGTFPGGTAGTVGNAGGNSTAVNNGSVPLTQSCFGGGGGGRRPTNATGGTAGATSTSGAIPAGGGGAGGGAGGGLYTSIATYYGAGPGGGFGAAGGGAVSAAPGGTVGGANGSAGGNGLGAAGGSSITKGGNVFSVTNNGTIWGTQVA